ncbi:MAG TPA: NAD-dependent epimerase/dehydratase family protein [Acidimicrobiales bacterium]|nr:NAD-dependent epimerase/dehydratase family protein [Acidimicrobiales bacterium]
MGKRVLITGLGSFWGGRMAQALEADRDVDHIIGLDVEGPKVPLERTEYVRADQGYSILARIVKATQIDTIVHTFLVVDSTHMSGRQLHETNVIGTMNLLAAAGAPESSVRHIIVKSSSLVYGSSMQDPAWFRETMQRVAPPVSRVERSLVEVESYLRDFAVDNPHVTVTLLRFANVLGTDIVTPISKALETGIAPAIMGFDPLMQFVEEDDVIRSLHFAFDRQLQGVYNVAGDGRIPWSEVAHICGVRLVPMLPPVLTGLTAGVLSSLGLTDLPPELLDLLRFGRGIDNRKLKAAGFRYRWTSAGAIDSFAQARRLRRAVGASRPAYTYERDVENFFRRSAAVVRRPAES